tara:strand:- start:80 stop:598 length:519 start_codon:yes stop_codon:yes gene_type:complete
MNNIIKGIKLIISGLFSPFKIIADKIYFMIGKKYYWVSLLEKIEKLEKEDKALKRDIISLDKYLYKSIDDLKEDINNKSSRITENANDLVDLIGTVDKIDKCVGQMETHHREVFETHLSKIAENRDNVSDLKGRINKLEDRLILSIKGLDSRVAELEPKYDVEFKPTKNDNL